MSTFEHAAKLLEQWTVDWRYLHSPIHCAAYVLNPVNRGKAMQQDPQIWPQFMEIVHKFLGPEQGSLAVEQYSIYEEVTIGFGGEMGAASAKTPAALYLVEVIWCLGGTITILGHAYPIPACECIFGRTELERV